MGSIKHPHIVVYVTGLKDYCIQGQEMRILRDRARSVFRVTQHIRRPVIGITMCPPAQCNLTTFMNQVIDMPGKTIPLAPRLYMNFGPGNNTEFYNLAVEFVSLMLESIGTRSLRPGDCFGISSPPCSVASVRAVYRQPNTPSAPAARPGPARAIATREERCSQ